MRHERMLALLLVALLGVALVAACSDGDPMDPGSSCVGLTFDDVLPTDETGQIIGSGGDGDWCWPPAGSDPSEPYLHPAFPNPFNSATTLLVTLPEAANLNLRVVDGGCRVVRTVFAGRREQGIWSFVWDGENTAGEKLPDGLYGIVLAVGDFTCAGVVELKSVP